MPLFGRNKPSAPPPQQHSSLFHRNPSPTYAEPDHTARSNSGGLFHRNNRTPSPQQQTSGGLFHRNRRASSPTAASTTNHNPGKLGGGILSKNRNDDHSIITARQHVLQAEKAEVEADRAKQQAQRAVREAKGEVKRLEREAEMQSKLAKHKADASKALGKRAKPLGRHGPTV